MRHPLHPKGYTGSIEPVEFGWTNLAGYADYSSRDMALRPDAGRYECGTLNTIGCYGLRASIDFLSRRHRPHRPARAGPRRQHRGRRRR